MACDMPKNLISIKLKKVQLFPTEPFMFHPLGAEIMIILNLPLQHQDISLHRKQK